MLYTGMRISDVATFDTSLRLKGNEIFVRMHKTKKELYTWVLTGSSIDYGIANDSVDRGSSR